MAKIVFASDHAGVRLKAALLAHAQELGHEVVDLGPANEESVDYPDFAYKLAEHMKEDNTTDFGVLVCGSGIGISIAANRYSHIRAAVCHNVTEARATRAHNNANVIAFGQRMIGELVAIEALETFLTTRFDGGRHERRVSKLDNPPVKETV